MIKHQQREIESVKMSLSPSFTCCLCSNDTHRNYYTVDNTYIYEYIELLVYLRLAWV